MGSCHESEPATAENNGLVVTRVRSLTPAGKFDRPLYLLKGEEIATKTQETDEGARGPQQLILKLYSENRPRLFGYIRSLHLNDDLVEEVIQETFLRLATELTRGTDIDNVPGWLMRVAHNLSMDMLKRRDRDATRITDIDLPEGEAFIDPKPGPYETFRQQQRIRQMEAELLTLNPQQRLCFQLRIRGFRLKDIGHFLGISEQRAAIVLKQATVRLAIVCGKEERK
jgi:RNA polymerase sigma-70 factor (ECF subfamily)